MRVLALLVFTVIVAACGGSSTAPTTTTNTVTNTAIETFIGNLTVAGTQFCPFTVTTAGTATVTLASLLASGSPVTTAVGLGVGTSTDTPTTSDCTLTNCTLATQFTTPTQFTAAPALTAQISTSVAKGQNCVAILDTGTMTVPLDFAIRVVHP